MRFQWWQTVLLEWDSNIANIAQLLRKKNESSEMYFFAIFHFFQLFFCQWLGKKPILTQRTIHTR